MALAYSIISLTNYSTAVSSLVSFLGSYFTQTSTDTEYDFIRNIQVTYYEFSIPSIIADPLIADSCKSTVRFYDWGSTYKILGLGFGIYSYWVELDLQKYPSIIVAIIKDRCGFYIAGLDTNNKPKEALLCSQLTSTIYPFIKNGQLIDSTHITIPKSSINIFKFVDQDCLNFKPYVVDLNDTQTRIGISNVSFGSDTITLTSDTSITASSYPKDVKFGPLITSLFVGHLGEYIFRDVTIGNSSNSSLTDQQISFTFDTRSLIDSGKLRYDLKNLRVLDSDLTELPFWVEPGTVYSSDTKIWVKVPNIPANDNKTIYLCYGANRSYPDYQPESVFVAVIPNALIHVSFDQVFGYVARDTSGNNHDATLSNVLIDVGKFGSGAFFDGNTSAVNFGTSGFYLNQLSIEFWFKTPESMGVSSRHVVSKSQSGQTSYRDFGIWFQSSNNSTVTGYQQSSDIFGSYTLTLPQAHAASTWYHLVLTISSSGLQKFYSNGQLLGNYQGTAGTANRSYPLVIGAADSCWNGGIDDFRLYSRALTDDEIYALANNAGITIPTFPGNVLVTKIVSQDINILVSSTERAPQAFLKVDSTYHQLKTIGFGNNRAVADYGYLLVNGFENDYLSGKTTVTPIISSASDFEQYGYSTLAVPIVAGVSGNKSLFYVADPIIPSGTIQSVSGRTVTVNIDLSNIDLQDEIFYHNDSQQGYIIEANTSNTITVATNFVTIPQANSTFSICRATYIDGANYIIPIEVS